MQRPRPLVLLILDGFGERPDADANAVRMAKTPAMDRLFAENEHTLIGASGEDVGLPAGQMGNSEVGHLSFGAGRIAKMDMTRIDDAVADGSFASNAVLASAIATAKTQGGAVHVMGLLSDGGVHSSIVHFIALCQMVQKAGVPLWVHAFTDGRDVAPGSAPGFVKALEEKLVAANAKIATVAGRFYAMDRDNRWERVERAYRAIVQAEGNRAPTAEAGLAQSFEAKKFDEFVEP
ncbi:MAG: 2,3-bisphosphoglycerate-independent phosphoglycerate mutase, partial [Proteobacteria bacterium]